MFVDLARASGDHLARGQDLEDGQRIAKLFRRLLTRSPDEAELAALQDFVVMHRTMFQEHSEQAAELMGKNAANVDTKAIAELATWTALSRALFALDEVVMRP